MVRLWLTAAAVGTLLLPPSAGALAQALGRPFVVHANVTVENSSSVPQIVAGTNVPPFELLPHQQAMLGMSALPAAPPGPGGTAPVRFEYSIGQAPGPQCHGTIDMTLDVQGTIDNSNQATHCIANSLGTGGAYCRIAVNAGNAVCHGGLAFMAP